MRNRRTLNALLALLAVGIVSVSIYAADPKPNFTGTWTIDVPLTAKANGKAAQPGRELTQRDSGAPNAPATMVMEMPNETSLRIKGGRGDTVYAIDGEQHKSKIPQRGGEMELVVKAKWDGVKLVTSVVQRMVSAGELNEVETKETRSIDKEGHLVYQFDRAQMGGGGGGGGGRGGGGGDDGGGGGGSANQYKAVYNKKP